MNFGFRACDGRISRTRTVFSSKGVSLHKSVLITYQWYVITSILRCFLSKDLFRTVLIRSYQWLLTTAWIHNEICLILYDGQNNTILVSIKLHRDFGKSDGWQEFDHNIVIRTRFVCNRGFEMNWVQFHGWSIRLCLRTNSYRVSFWMSWIFWSR